MVTFNSTSNRKNFALVAASLTLSASLSNATHVTSSSVISKVRGGDISNLGNSSAPHSSSSKPVPTETSNDSNVSKRKKKKKRKSSKSSINNVSTKSTDVHNEKGNIEVDSKKEGNDSSSSMKHGKTNDPNDVKRKEKQNESNDNSSKSKPRKEESAQNRDKQNPSAAVPPPPKAKDSSNGLIEEIIQSQDLYHILNLDKGQKLSYTSVEITKAYRRRCVLTHPDKLNGDRRAFDKVSEAYDVLKDEEKKKIYDRYGLEAVKDPDFAARASMGSAFSGMGSSFQDQIFKSFFGSAAPTSGPRGFNRMPRKNNDMKYELEVSLEDMYKGAHREVRISQPNGPKVVDLDIPAGVLQGSTIRLSGMVDHIQSATPGDVIFIIRQKQNPRFTRKGHDLAMELKISLGEAICGFEREIVHLDGRKIHVNGPISQKIRNGQGEDTDSVPEMIKTGDVHVLKGEGMPKKLASRPYDYAFADDDNRLETFGDLYIQYEVEMPSTNDSKLQQRLTNEERKTLGILLNKLQGINNNKDKNESASKAAIIKELMKSDASNFGRASGKATPERIGDEDGDHMHTEDEDQHHYSRGFQYFSSGGQFFSRGSSPFTSSSSYGADDDGDVQCQQM
ncbi:hypothetical protein CTEN210_07717 [Chaetoceros tenuissimus]|uniref:J domain-containing protein n=1 Tax=Chaetoceros tenuissimus TaxID=426638 RepID=A0AAD3H5P6_9STRA|nr:hypothetical protein CTEN210_07717 [Chaetoceros tenuissimus]